MHANLSHVETWIFDLDNTLYHPSARLFDRINARMTGFIMRVIGVGRAAMIEDDVRDLEAPKSPGMATVWLCHRIGARTPAFAGRRIARLIRFPQELA